MVSAHVTMAMKRLPVGNREPAGSTEVLAVLNSYVILASCGLSDRLLHLAALLFQVINDLFFLAFRHSCSTLSSLLGMMNVEASGSARLDNSDS